jgi:hypothetical protein
MRALLQLEPGNRDVRALHVRFRKESAAASAKEAQFFSKAFQRMAREPVPAPAPAPAPSANGAAPAAETGVTANGNPDGDAAESAAAGSGDVEMGEAAGGTPDQAPGGLGQAALVEAVEKASTSNAADVGVIRP